MQLLIGADPEFFLKKGKRNVSAHGLIPGSKDKPHKLKHGSCQLDGTAIEFNIDPVSTAHEFVNKVKEVQRQIRRIIPKEYSFDIRPAVFYGPKYFEKLPDDVKQLGCNPDHDAYNKGERNPMPENVGTMRTGAGHIHFGWGKNFKVDDASHIADCIMLVRNIDALVGRLEHLWDNDVHRRAMYGKLGCFRPKPYGVEYRSLSNAWVAHEELYPFIYSLMRYAFYVTTNGKNIEKLMPPEKKFSKELWNYFIRKSLPSVFGGYPGEIMQPPVFPVNFELKEKDNGPRVRKSKRR